MTARIRNGSRVYTTKQIADQDLFPGAGGVYFVDIPAGAEGKVRECDEGNYDSVLYKVEFKNKKHGEWWLSGDQIQRTKPK